MNGTGILVLFKARITFNARPGATSFTIPQDA